MRKFGFLFLFLAALFSPTWLRAQTHTFPAQDTNNTFTGTNTFPNINNVVYVDGTKYPTTAAGVNLAIASFGSNPGIVNITNPGNYTDALITPANGTVLQFGAGIYNYCGISGADSTTAAVTWAVRGQGREQTYLSLGNNCNVDGITDNHFGTLAGNNWGVFRVVLNGFTLYGNKPNNASGNGIRLYGRAVNITDVIVEDFVQDGLDPYFSGTDAFVNPTDDLDWVITNSKEVLNGGDGFFNHASSDLQMINNTSWGNGGYGYQTGYSMFVDNINAFLNASGGCRANGSGTASAAAFFGSAAECTAANGFGLLIDATGAVGATNLTGAVIGCVGCPGLQVGSQNNYITGQFVNSTPAIKFNGGSAIGNWVEGTVYGNTGLVNWNSSGGASTVILGGTGTGTMFTGSVPGNSEVYVNAGGTTNPNGGPILTATLGAGGTGYRVNDTGYVTGGGDQNAAYTITGIGGGGAVTTFLFNSFGSSYQVANGITTTVGYSGLAGSGTGFTINVTSVSSVAYISHANSGGQGSPAYVNIPNTFNFRQVFSQGAAVNNTFYTQAIASNAAVFGTINGSGSDDTGFASTGLTSQCSGSFKCGYGFTIGGSGAAIWETAAALTNYHQVGLALIGTDTNAKDLNIQPAADDTAFGIQETNHAANANVFTVNHLGAVTAASISTATGSTAGYFQCTQGTANGHATANTITVECPASVTAYEEVKPGSATTGIYHATNAANVLTDSISAVVSADLNITTTTCTNQVVSAISATAVGTCHTIVGGDMASNTVTATQLATQYSKGSCTEVWGGSGASFAMTSGDDAISNNSCYNDSGVTRTITAVKCASNYSSNTTTVNPTFGSAGTGTTILSGALTCGNSYAYSSTGTVSNASWTTGAGIDPGMGGTLTNTTSIAMIVEYTF